MNASVAGLLERAGRILERLAGLDETELAPLEGRRLWVELSGLERRVELAVHDGHLRLDWPGPAAAPADVCLRGGPFSLARLAAAGAGDPGALRAAGIEIRGDLGVAQRFADLLERLRPDVERALAAAGAGPLAYRAGRVVERLLAELRRAAAGLAESTAAWTQDEAGVLPASGEVEAFCTAVDDLRDDLARLEARLVRLEGRG